MISSNSCDVSAVEKFLKMRPETTVKSKFIVLLIHSVHQPKIKMDFAQRSSSKCKNYLLKIYSQHGNFLNAI